ncbi:class I SAM-dependent DNA methyltransferase [Chryseobacterium sp. SG20098]|uniref:HsdM family class I SAM-dependent methyltransferase n=1 Tax=Chryseobacterium sp. SG20098 TaxID=3074145 RepID=UPI002883286C|nr:class I SAM-dependent DNA methyltransferase [Chryseobacterium sp. SG20098]WNI35934.1 class I SAM-dependent DNA methyltransferase [Chryseobacterium sp. SG20098]
MLNSTIKNKIQLLWDRLWGGGLSNPITAIENISYLLFMKRLEKFHPQVNVKYKWSDYHSLKDENLKERILETFNFIQNDLANEGEPFAVEMKKAQFGINNATLLEDAIKIVDDIYVEIEKEEKENQHFQDIQGDVYEYLLKATNEAGKNGQFRTPRHIIQMMAELIKPSIEDKNTRICDVTSGSSGFLVGSYQYILKEKSKHKELDEENQLEKGLDGDNLSKVDKKRLTENTFYGFDIDATMVRIGMMNMMMHGISKPQIINLNTLSNEYEQYFQMLNLDKINLHSIIGEIKGSVIHTDTPPKGFNPKWGAEEFDYILANPPFAAKVNAKTISKNLNRIYTINPDAKKAQTLQTELLFLERIIYMLKKDGKGAVIVPEGVLFNSGTVYKKVREILLKDCNLEAVISLPSGVFNPYTAVKTSILLFTKKQFESTDYNTEKVWFYGMDSDGYTLDNSRKKIKNEFPLPETIKQFDTRNNKNNPQIDRLQRHFYVPIKEIEENDFELNYNLYKDFVFEEQTYEPPKELLSRLLNLENEINEGLSKLNISINEN